MSPSPTLNHLSVQRTARIATLGDPASASVVWVALHGYGQLAADFLQPFGSTVGAGRCVVAPEGLSRFYVDGNHERVGASWMTREDRETEIEDYVSYLDATIEALPLNPDSVSICVLGFSQGAATASRWALLGDTDIARLVLWGGTLAHDLDLAEHAPTLRQMDLIVVGGTDDPYISSNDRNQFLERLDDNGISARTYTFDGGHRLHRPTLETLFFPNDDSHTR